MFIRFCILIVVILLGILVALPISYLFQSELYEFITLNDYVFGIPNSILFAYEFGSWSIYRNTVIATIIVFVIIMNVIETIFFKEGR